MTAPHRTERPGRGRRRAATGLLALAVAAPVLTAAGTAEAAVRGSGTTGTTPTHRTVRATATRTLPAPRAARRALPHWQLRGSCDHVYYREINGAVVARSNFGGGERLDDVTSVRILRQAGFTWAQMQVALATMTAESDRCPRAVGYNLDPKTGAVRNKDVGLWQINLTYHPKYASWDLMDPLTASRAAKEIYDRSGWTPWHGYAYHGLYMSWAGWAIEQARAAGVR